MRIGVLSDTHTDSIDKLPGGLVKVLTGMDMILHAGDFTERMVLEKVRGLGKFVGVYGNLDSFDVKKELHAIETVEAGGFKIGLNHPAEGGAPLNLEDRLRPKFQDVNVIVFGHSHQPTNQTKEGVLFFNPGSATGTAPARKKTFGILHVDKNIRGEIIKL
ncbi:MAG: metallophosphoesterase family protein [Candidatus Aenigmarchaeota archaeon]|nr:metallophosphoesterase family protein [Candidatus Aenigmarchaeota archaeon]